MEELILNIAKETLQELKKANKLPYPLYYKEVFNLILEEKDIKEQINPKLLCEVSDDLLILKTKETIEFAKKTSNNIKSSSEEIVEVIDEVDVDELKKSIILFTSNIIKEIEKLNKKITELEKELEKAHKELLIDSLTKVYNRKAFERDLDLVLKNKEKRCIAILDLDNFRKINEEYGHLIGDYVLIKFASILNSFVKEAKIYRYGGDEFILLFDLDEVKVKEIIKKILNKINKTKLKYKDYIIPISVSIGMMCIENDNLDSIFKKLEKSLKGENDF